MNLSCHLSLRALRCCPTGNTTCSFYLRKPKFAAGFTLLELLLALFLSGLVILLLTAGTNFIARDWLTFGAHIDKDINESLALLQLERAFEGAFPHLYSENDKENKSKKYIYFEGDGKEVRWVSTISPQRLPGLTAWRLVADEDKGLLLYIAPAFTDNPDPRLESVEPRVFLPGYKSHFEFLAEEGKKLKWVEGWSARKFQSLPRAIHLSLIPFDSGEEVPSLELLVDIRAYEHFSIKPVPYKNEM